MRPHSEPSASQPPPAWATRRAPALQAAVAVGLPLAVAGAAGDIQAGGVATLGALAALYGHGVPYRRRAVRLAGIGAGLVAAAALGTAGSGSGAGTVAAIAVVAAVAAFWSRRRSVPPPGALMPVLVAATATQIPLAAVPPLPRLGLVALGAAGAWLVTMAGALRRWHTWTATPTAREAPPLPVALRAACRIAAGTGGAALVALAVGLPRPDWAAAACAAVLVHDQSRATLRRARHRAVGTAAGIGLAGLVLVAQPGLLATVALVVGLQFVVELVVARNYTVAVLFITPLALFLGLLATGHPIDAAAGPLLIARLLETAVGCVLAVAVHALCPPPGARAAIAALRPRAIASS